MFSKKQRGNAIVGILTGLLSVAFVISLFAAWVTHVLVCIKAASWVLLLIGAFIFPVGIIHGYGLWFGIF